MDYTGTLIDQRVITASEELLKQLRKATDEVNRTVDAGHTTVRDSLRAVEIADALSAALPPSDSSRSR